MMTQLIEVLASRMQNNAAATPSSKNPSVGSFVAHFERLDFCWEAKGPPKEKFLQELRPQITRYLKDYFGPAPANDHFTLSLYMVGRSTDTAIPTIMFISRNSQSRRDVRKVMKESGLLSLYPEFRTKYCAKDPGSVNIVPLAPGKTPNRAQITEDAIEVLYDASKPLGCMGLPIYIRHLSSLRPATANAVQIGDRLFFQTVHHAFHNHPSILSTTTIATDQDQEIDSDSESDTDHDDGAHIAITSVGSRSTDTLSCPASSDSGRSQRSTFTSGASTPTAAITSQDHLVNETPFEDNTAMAAQWDNATTYLRHTTADLSSFATTGHVFELKQPVQPALETLSLLGKLMEESAENDWALIEIINSRVEEKLRAILKQNKVHILAYDKTALFPKDDAKIYTYTASGGKLCGVLSSTPSYTRLPNSTSFREVYVVRLDGPLADGDCGSAVIDVTTGDTYGHLVAGCRTTGTAYILAAYQITEDFRKILMRAPGDVHFPISDYTDSNFFRSFTDLGIERNFLDFFAQHSIGSIPSLDAERIQHFCKHDKTKSTTETQTVIQLRDREYLTNESRKYPDELSPEQLWQALNEDRFGHTDLPDASRRQILVKHLDVKSLQVLAESAAWHQVVPLRDAMSKHMSGETSFKVRRQIGHSETPFLELHLPYLALRKELGGKPAGFHYNQDNSDNPRTNLFVPDFAAPGGKQESGYAIHEAQISIMLCIWDHSKWVAYAFSRPCPNSTSDESEDQNQDGDGSEDEYENWVEVPQPTEDIFAPDNGLHNLSEDHTIWDPRIYYLRITAIWVDVIRREYTYLVETLDISIKAWRVEVRNSASEAFIDRKQDLSAARLLNSTVEMMQLLREVREHILLAIRAWDSFRETDMEFFADLNNHDAKVSLSDIKSSFDRLVDLNQKLIFLDDFFADSAKFLKLRLTLESNETSRHAHHLNTATNLISREIHTLNRVSTEAAIANAEAAEKISRTTRNNVMIIWIITPLILVLQYFSVDRPIFSFERNTKTFIIAVCVVFLTLPLLTFALHSVERIRVAIWSILGVKRMTKRNARGESDAIELQPRYPEPSRV